MLVRQLLGSEEMLVARLILDEPADWHDHCDQKGRDGQDEPDVRPARGAVHGVERLVERDRRDDRRNDRQIPLVGNGEPEAPTREGDCLLEQNAQDRRDADVRLVVDLDLHLFPPQG